MNVLTLLQALRIGFAIACVCALQSARAGQFIFLPQGSATLIRATSVVNVDAPVALEQGDLLATTQGGGQLETDGTIVALGAQTRVAIDATPTGDRLALLSGWIKVAHGQTAATARVTAPLAINTVLLDVTLNQGAAVLHASRDTTSLFVETGSVTLALPGREDAHQQIEGEHYAAREAGKPLDVSTRASQSFIGAMPVPFRDSLAPFPIEVKRKLIVVSQGRPATYADLADWLVAPLPIRRGFVSRFRPLALGEPFRSQVRRHLRELPEWRRVLYPPHAAPRLRPLLPMPVPDHPTEVGS